jgi:hypothetical protein
MAYSATFSANNDYSGVLLYNLNSKNEIEQQFANNVGMLPILEYLDKGLVDNNVKPTKFICLMCIRKEADRFNETIKTLEFANQIKST